MAPKPLLIVEETQGAQKRLTMGVTATLKSMAAVAPNPVARTDIGGTLTVSGPNGEVSMVLGITGILDVEQLAMLSQRANVLQSDIEMIIRFPWEDV